MPARFAGLPVSTPYPTRFPFPGFGFFFGGLCQLLAGLLEYQRKNTLAMVAFVSYGGFWISFCFAGTLNLAGIYPSSVKGTQMMLCMWGIYTFVLWLCTFSTNLIFSATFLTLSMLFFFLAGGQTNHNFMKFAGVWGYLVTALAWYLGTAMLLADLYGTSPLPLFPLKPIHGISGGTIGTRRRVEESPDPEAGKA